jgi:hypothetical protein
MKKQKRNKKKKELTEKRVLYDRWQETEFESKNAACLPLIKLKSNIKEMSVLFEKRGYMLDFFVKSMYM